MKKIFAIVMAAASVLAVSCSKGCLLNDDAAYEQFASEIELMEQQFTMVYNTTVLNEENAARFEGNSAYEGLIDVVTSYLSGIQQTIDTKKTWAEESYNAHTLAKDLDEILGSFENDIQIPLTQVLNLYNDVVEKLGPDSEMLEELFMALEGYEQQLTMSLNATVYNEEMAIYEGLPGYAELCENTIALFSGISQTIQTKKEWILSSFEAGTLAEDAEEIYSTFESDIQIPMTQAMNFFNDGVANFETYYTLYSEIQALQQQFTMTYNATVNNQDDADLYSLCPGYDTLISNVSDVLNGVSQTIEGYFQWIEESVEKGTLAEEAEEIRASFETGVQIPLTNAKNLYDDGLKNFPLYFELYQAIQGMNGLEQQWTMVYNATVNNEEDKATYAGVTAYEDLVNEVTSILSGIAQNIDTLKTWVEESCTNLVLVDDANDIYQQMEPIQMQLTQAKNRYDDGLAEITIG